MDPLSFLIPSRVKVLLVPVGDITPEQFNFNVVKIQEISEIHLSDISIIIPEPNELDPRMFPQGRVYYDYSLTVGDLENLYLFDFECFRKTFIVIGVGHNIKKGLRKELESLRKISKTAIVHSIINFADSQEHDSIEEEEEKNLENIFHHINNPASNIETLLCDITSSFLIELSKYIASYQHITPRSPVAPTGLAYSSSLTTPINSNININATSSGSAITATLKKKRISSGSSITLSASTKISLTSASERRSTRIKGRQLKITASLFLLAGQHFQSLNKFIEAWKLLKVSNDHLWLGSCLEGIAVCLVLLRFAGSSFQANSLLGLIIGKSKFSSPGDISSPVNTPRNSINSSNGVTEMTSEQIWSTYTLTEIVTNLLTKTIDFYELSRADGEDSVPVMVYCESILRYMKFLTVDYVTSGGLSQDDTFAALSAMVRGLSISEDLMPNQGSKNTIYKLGMKITQIRIKDLDLVNQCKIHSCLAAIYGDLGYERKKAFTLRQLLLTIITELTTTSATSSDPGQLLKFLNSIMKTYGLDRSPETLNVDLYSQSRWPQIHKSLIILCVSLCEKLQCFQELASLKSLLLCRYLDALTDNEQLKLLSDLKRINSERDVEIVHFDPFVIRAVTIIPPSNGPTKQKITNTSSFSNTDLSPFIYNPFETKKEIREIFLIQDEYVEFQITVQNPFGFVLEITKIEIPGFEVLKSHFNIPAKTLKTVSIMTKPTNHSGQQKLSQIRLKTFNFSTSVFPIVSDLKPEIMAKCKSSNHPESMESLWDQYTANMMKPDLTQVAKTSNVEIYTIPPQPSLQIIKPSPQLLLLEGQTSATSITLKNSSRVPINHIRFHVNDSTIPTLQDILAQGGKGLPYSEIHEIEYFIHRKNAITIVNPIKEIAAGEEVTLDLQIFAKRGMEFALLAVDYGYNKDNEKDAEFLFTKRIENKIVAIVNPSLELAGCDVIGLSQLDSLSGYFKNVIKDDDESYVLFSLDLRNTWSKPLSIALAYESYSLTDTIAPLETKRFLLPVSKFLISPPIQPIPRLSNKQHIVSKMTKAEDEFQRESFWYREHILSKLQGTWSIDEFTKGMVEFRGIRLSQKMLHMLKIDLIELSISLKNHVKSGSGSYIVQTDEPFVVVVKIINKTNEPISGVLRNVPTLSSFTSVLEKRLLYFGALQHPIPDEIAVGEQYIFEIGAIVLESGEYEWGAILDLNDVAGELGTVGVKWPIRIRAV